MPISKRKKLLLNAEPFGFGPAAAIATLFPELVPYATEVGYIGEGHTLDLQRPLEYDCVIDCAEYSEEEIITVMKDYDVFLTALDFGMARLARAAGLRVVIYDPLTWYWREIPPIIASVDLYVAQDFFGVRERIEKTPNCFSPTVIVPPIVTPGKRTGDNSHVLLNLGGLQNPFWSFEETVTYARSMIRLVRAALYRDEVLVITTSHSVAVSTLDPAVRTASIHEMHRLMSQAKYAIMTPGLGNIYDAASFGLPILWLPPANDSQGQQLRLLEEAGMTDAALDWHDLCTGIDKIDYKGEQEAVLEQIRMAAQYMNMCDEADRRFQSAVDEIRGGMQSRLGGLIDSFGTGGAAHVTRSIRERNIFV